ncbi:MAG: hypothetical protein Q9222_007561 [Ikaeria aurantiellina]
MRFFRQAGLLSLLSTLCLVSLASGQINAAGDDDPDVGGILGERESTCIETGTCPSIQDRDDDRTKCNPDQCPKVCKPGKSKKRSFSGGLTTRSTFALNERFFEPSAPNQLVNELLRKDYTENQSEGPSSYKWHHFHDKAYAAAIKGLSGCTAVIVVSEKGAFTAHLFEEDPHTHHDLQEKNYKKTVKSLKDKLSPHKKDLKDGEAFIMMPSQPNNSNKDLYGADTVKAIKDAVKDASGLEGTRISYVPLDSAKSPNLGNNERGTAAIEFDPKYKKDGKGDSKKAYRVWMESLTPRSEKTW